jgi:hypothetical protein
MIMLTTQLQQEEQQETARELADILRIAQEMGQRLSRETHGELYDDVREFNEQLSQVRRSLDALAQKFPGL